MKQLKYTGRIPLFIVNSIKWRARVTSGITHNKSCSAGFEAGDVAVHVEHLKPLSKQDTPPQKQKKHDQLHSPLLFVFFPSF